MAKKLITMKFDPELLERLDAVAKADGVDRTTYVTQAIEAAISGGLKITNATKQRSAFNRIVDVMKDQERVGVSSLAIAGWGENKPKPGSLLKQPKKGK